VFRPFLCVPHFRATRFPLSDAPPWTRQRTAAFNQPLSFDTSSVRSMGYMFVVRFRLRLLPTLPSWATRTCRARCVFRPSLCVPHLRATRFPSAGCPPPLDSAGRDCFQPAAEL